MKYAVFLNSVLPVRAEPGEQSEMVTQLLFGDFCEVIENFDSFVHIRNYRDGYKGWVDKKMLDIITSETYESLMVNSLYRTKDPIVEILSLTDNTIYRLSIGSFLPFYDMSRGCFGIAEKQFSIDSSAVIEIDTINLDRESVVYTAKQFLNVPYLWGGKNIMGIDCSGFTQVVYSLVGYILKRDAREQAEQGCLVDIGQATTADLMFFEKNERITHVGIYMGNDRIIHASGRVRIDRIDERGIYNEELNTYTHQLSMIRRI